MPLPVLRLADCPAQPWRNGGGTTRELLAWPSADAWALRLSVAEIARDGPFSAFAGVDRWFAVLAGPGVELVWPDHVTALTSASAPLAFDGADPPLAKLLGGASQDLNLMLRRERLRGSLRRATPGLAWHSSAPLRGLYTLSAAQLQRPDAPAQELPAASLVFSDAAKPGAWSIARPAQAYWIEAQP